MRVGVVCPYDWGVPGGVQAHVRDLAEELIRQGHDVSVLSPADDDVVLPPYVTSAGRAIPVPYNGSVARLSFGPRAASRVRRWIREGEFDVLHVHEPASPSLSVLACWAAIGPIVATFHMSSERSRAMAAAYGILQTVLEKVSARIAVSEHARTTLVEHLGGDAVLIPNGVSLSSFNDVAPFEEWPGTGGALGFLGRIDEPRKGLQLLLDALPTLVRHREDLRLLVAGPGDSDAVDDLPDALRSHVTLLGLVSQEQKARAFRSVDLFVAPNTGGESFGVVLLEAMASRTPVLASDLEAFRRVLDDGKAGRLFANGDSDALATAALDLLEDPSARLELTGRADQVVRRYDWASVAAEVVEVYETVTVSGAKVREDSRGQALGRFTRLKDDS
jgi:phosphatidylinositol alpha-mannosyltransferase